MSRAHRRAIPPHIIEHAWEVFCQSQYASIANGGQGTLEGPNDKLYFISGFVAALGVLVGTIDVGIPEGTPSYDVIQTIVNEEIPRYAKELARLQEQAHRISRGDA